MSRTTIFLLALAIVGTTAAVRPARAEPANPITSAEAAEAALSAPSHSLVELNVFASFDQLPREVRGGHVGISARALLGQSLSYCLGADASIGASSEGILYGAVLQLIGAGLRIGDSSYVSLCGGAGIGGARDVVPSALEFPLELAARAQAGPLRLAASLLGRFTRLSDARKDGSHIAGVDEFEATVSAGWGRQKTYWQGSSAGSGPYLAFSYRELMGERVFVVSLGLDLLGAN